MPNDQKSLNDQKMYAKQLGQLFSKISYNFTKKLILNFTWFDVESAGFIVQFTQLFIF